MVGDMLVEIPQHKTSKASANLIIKLLSPKAQSRLIAHRPSQYNLFIIQSLSFVCGKFV